MHCCFSTIFVHALLNEYLSPRPATILRTDPPISSAHVCVIKVESRLWVRKIANNSGTRRFMEIVSQCKHVELRPPTCNLHCVTALWEGTSNDGQMMELKYFGVSVINVLRLFSWNIWYFGFNSWSITNLDLLFMPKFSWYCRIKGLKKIVFIYSIIFYQYFELHLSCKFT